MACLHDTIVTAPGSLGDVNPLLAIARYLQQRGRRVVFLAAERYLHLAERAGLACHPLVDEESFAELLADPLMWHPRHGARLILDKAVSAFLRPHYAWLEQNCQPGRTLLISHVLDFAGRIYRDRHPQTRMVSVLLAPALLRSRRKPPRLSGYFWERWIPKALLPAAYWSADQWVDRMCGSEINALRGELGLPPVRRLLHRWWWSPDCVLGLFPEWFSVPENDLLPNLHLVGFPLADSGDVLPAAAHDELTRVLQHFQSERPLVFAPGTAHHHAGRYLHCAVEACRKLERPAILISTDPSQIPGQLPANILAARYLPFSQLLPYTAGIVHHGGVGTTSQALAAGIPQVVLPMAFDQFDNAERVARLGCGNWLPMQGLTTRRLERCLLKLPQAAGGVAEVQATLRAEPPWAKRLEAAVRPLLEPVD